MNSMSSFFKARNNYGVNSSVTTDEINKIPVEKSINISNLQPNLQPRLTIIIKSPLLISSSV